MTQFKLMSDLHLEFFRDRLVGGKYRTNKAWQPEELPYDKDVVLLLPGDIHVGTKAKPWLKRMCKRYRAVVYVLGNHEFYHNEFYAVKNAWRDMEMPDNFFLLDDDWVVIDNTRILGGTMWTDVQDPVAKFRGQQGMSDYNVIIVEYPPGKFRKLNVQDTNVANMMTVAFLKEMLRTEFDGNTIVMTHHLPHPLCVNPIFKAHPLNPFYLHNMDEVIENNNINVWCHGHTHNNVDVEIHGTRILCNPRGYHGQAINPDYIEDLIFEL